MAETLASTPRSNGGKINSKSNSYRMLYLSLLLFFPFFSTVEEGLAVPCLGVKVLGYWGTQCIHSYSDSCRTPHA